MTIRPHVPSSATGEPRRRGDEGFVLAAAAFGLLVVIVLVTGGFFIARQEFQVGMANEHAAEAFYLTERSLTEFVGSRWNLQTYGALPTWTPTTVVDTIGDAELTVELTRLGERTYFVDGTAVTVNRGFYSGASRRIGTVMKLFSPVIEPPAALTTRGETEIKGTAEVHGEDLNPTAWAGYCAGFGGVDKPGILTNDTSLVTLGSAVTNYTGNPPLAEDPSIGDATFTQFGEVGWDELVAMADKTLGSAGAMLNITGSEPVLKADGTCDKFALLNWGDPENPTAPCGDYFPTVYSRGGLRIQSGGVGQGVLLVDGTLDLRGDFVWYGIIIVQGSFETQGNGNRVFGGVLASNASFDSQGLVGGSVVTNSTCSATRAVLYNSALTRLRPLAARSWVDLSGVEN
jgi:hypothetical protein